MEKGFSKDMTIFEALHSYPGAKEIFQKYGMGCLGCMGAELETIESGARMHGIQINELLKDLNKLLENPGSGGRK